MYRKCLQYWRTRPTADIKWLPLNSSSWPKICPFNVLCIQLQFSERFLHVSLWNKSHPIICTLIQNSFLTQTEAAWYINYLRGLFSQNLWKVIKFWLNIFKNKSLVLAEDNFPRNLEVFSKNYTKGPNNSFILVENSGLVQDWSSGSLLNPCKSLQNCLVDSSHCHGLLKGNHLNRRIKYLSNTSTCFFFFIMDRGAS